MSGKDDSSQFLFLITCIKNSNNGKLEIVSKGAAAKRYERLMKAHGIGTNGNSGSSAPKKSPVKKEKGGDSSKPASKKRKLKEVDENAPDEDEPIKGEVKSEIKFEDAINVKIEQSNGGVAVMAAPASTLPTPHEALERVSQDDDDEVLVISATEKKSDGSLSVYGGDNHHHHHHTHMSAQHIPGFHSFDYAANMGYPLQTAPPMSPMMTMPAVSRPSSGNVLPYGFTPSPFGHNHNTPGFFWHGQHMMARQSEGHHMEESTDKGL
ncbi:hypothetical protein BKA67DRAFT_540969 [Truncatella angustata]|uniref:Myb-like DNA-binding domain-containing protein n=1 Tax=Truncatella angustata TaxID=152316 RepID=A0A9P8RKY7_9PEZI|nr:uncharacterized protein BKA67DRAFT_540969 [Truncatella angustata]KAH6645976.1 hypothetical protein BKA67DRAFT_540969 [Truncatella angustata]